MNKEFVPYEEALALKELGFDEPCLSSFDENKNLFKVWENDMVNGRTICLAPLYQQAFRWFREKYNLRGFIGFRPNVKMFDYHIYDMSLSGLEYTKQRTMEEFNKDPKVGTYEEAELACLREMIKLVKENENQI
jgi:hypothetical protein